MRYGGLIGSLGRDLREYVFLGPMYLAALIVHSVDMRFAHRLRIRMSSASW